MEKLVTCPSVGEAGGLIAVWLVPVLLKMLVVTVELKVALPGAAPIVWNAGRIKSKPVLVTLSVITLPIMLPAALTLAEAKMFPLADKVVPNNVVPTTLPVALKLL